MRIDLEININTKSIFTILFLLLSVYGLIWYIDDSNVVTERTKAYQIDMLNYCMNNTKTIGGFERCIDEYFPHVYLPHYYTHIGDYDSNDVAFNPSLFIQEEIEDSWNGTRNFQILFLIVGLILFNGFFIWFSFLRNVNYW